MRLALALALSVALTSSAAAKGPPWIGIELRPYGTAFIVARTYHHGTPMALALTGTAEGLVDGRRSSVPLRFEHTDDAAAVAVPNSWGASGVWVLNIGTGAGDHGSAGVAVGVDRSGTPAFVRFPRALTGESRIATRGEVEAMLRALEAGQPPPALSRAGWIPLLLRTFGPLLVLGTAVGLIAKLLILALRHLRAPRVKAVAT